MFSLICAWINGWVNYRESVDLRHNNAHYDVTVSPDQQLSSHALLDPSCFSGYSVIILVIRQATPKAKMESLTQVYELRNKFITN